MYATDRTRSIRNIFHLLLVPIQFYGTLQRLNLCPAWPLLPNAFSKSYFQPMLPPLPTIWNRRSLGSYAASLVFSPLATYTYMTIFHITVNSKLGVYTRAGLPRPDNPDSASMRLGDDPDTAMTAPVLEYPKLQGSVHQEFNKDLQHIRASIKRVESFVLSSYRQLSYILGVPTVSSSTMESHADTRAHPVRFAQDPLSPTTTPLESPEQNPAINPGIHPAQTQLSSSTSTPSPPRSPTSSQDPDSPALEPSNVQIRTRTGSTSTLHMDVEVNAPLNGGPVFTSSFAASPRPAILESNAPPTVSGK